MQVDQRILQVGQLQPLDHALDQLAVADRRRSGQAAGRSRPAAAQHRAPGRLGHLEPIERASDRWADLAEPVGAENPSTSCDLGIFVDQPADAIQPHDRYVGRWSRW
jgi:hypothetical protein